MPKIILVHGRDHQFFNPGSVLYEWQPALEWGLERAEAKSYQNLPIGVGFYGDVWLADAHEESDRALESYGGETSPTSKLELALAQDILEAAGIRVDGEVEVIAGDEDDEEKALETYRGGIRDKIVGGIALLERFLPGWANNVVLNAAVKDVGEYLENQKLREEVIGRVADKIRKAEDEVILIAHSLGTVVSYDVLTYHPELPVTNYISLASPLGFKTVRNVVTDNGQKGFPAQLASWTNIYNLEDFVCAVRELAELFPASNGRIIADIDAGEGRKSSFVSPFAAHDVRVYLHSKAFGHTLRAILEK